MERVCFCNLELEFVLKWVFGFPYPMESGIILIIGSALKSWR